MRRLRDWLVAHDAGEAVVGVESPAGYGRLLVASLEAAGHEVLNVPAWRTHRERRRHGPGKTDPGDAIAVAQVVLRKRAELGPALEPELVRALRCSSCSAAVSSATAPRRSSGSAPTGIRSTRSARRASSTSPASASCAGSSGSASATASSSRSQPAASATSPATSTTSTSASPRSTREIAELLAEHGNPVADLHGAGTQIAAAVIAHAGDVRRFRDAAAFARFCGAAPIPCGSGQTAGRHRLHRGGNRQLNAALYRIAIVQARHHPPARAYLARKIAEGKTPREARRALKRHLANVIYRRLYTWAETTPALNT